MSLLPLCRTCARVIVFHIYCALHFSHVISVSALCSSEGFLIVPLLTSHCFLKNAFHIPYGHQVIEVQAVLTHFFIPTSSSLLINSSFHMLSFHTSVIFVVSIVTSVLIS